MKMDLINLSQKYKNLSKNNKFCSILCKKLGVFEKSTTFVDDSKKLLLNMRKIGSYLFILLVVAMYVVSTMGYGIHECKHDGTRDVIVLFGETPCEYIHSHVDDTGHIFTHAHTACDCGMDHVVYEHDGNCCQTTVYSVTTDQTVEDSNLSVQPSVKICFVPLIPQGGPAAEFFPESVKPLAWLGKTPPGGSVVCILNGVLRV